ncbi:MAG: hypothetical protein MUO23_13350 [Anaerolineales bacterium]|nr:hypothetical protein [Anaerolineales bacterium]
MPTTDDSNQAVVYRDALALGWEDWSWDSSIQLASTQHAHASDGTVSIRAELEPWGALSLQYPSGFHTSPYQWIEFYIYVGENTLRRLSFVFNGNSDNDLLPRVSIDDPRYIAGGTYIANRWQRVRIPLADTGGSETVIWGININDASGDGQEPFWVDGIRFLASTPLATPGPEAALPTFDASNQAVVYRDVLSLGWEDWSWDSDIQLASTQHAHATDGTVSIRAELEPWGALSLRYPPGFRTSAYQWIEFYIYVGENTLRRLSFVFGGNADSDLLPRVSIDDPRYIAGEKYIANRWQRVRIPLTDTGGADTVIWGMSINDASGDGQEPFWVDGTRFLTSTPLATPAPTLPPKEASAAVVYQNKLALAWEDWSWYSTVDVASREHAHSKPLSIKASLGPTGALSLHVPGFNTAPYHWLEFYIYVGDNTLRQLSVYFNDTADKELMPKVSVDDPDFIAMGAYIPNRWQRVRIPLSRTGGADTDILRINIKDESGAGQEAFWIDDIRLLPADPESR